jgi:aspartate aminotransferase, cytoplasmic
MILIMIDERVGCLIAVTRSKSVAANVKSQMSWIIRKMISNPPAFGARIVATVLNNTELYQEW